MFFGSLHTNPDKFETFFSTEFFLLTMAIHAKTSFSVTETGAFQKTVSRMEKFGSTGGVV